MLRSAPVLLTLALALPALRSQAGFCDLSIQGLATPAAKIVAGSPLRVSFTVVNQSRAACPRPTTAKLRLSTDRVYSGDDVALAELVIPALLPGRSKTVVADVRVPYCIALGTRWLVARADAKFEVGESIEINNDAAIACSSFAWSGQPRIEYRPTYDQPVGMEDQTISAWAGGRLRMCVTAPGHLGDWYVVLWSASQNFVPDQFTTFSLTLLNTVFQPRWFSRLANGIRAYPDYYVPAGIRFTGSFQVFVHTFFVDPSFSVITGKTSKPITLTIKS